MTHQTWILLVAALTTSWQLEPTAQGGSAARARFNSSSVWRKVLERQRQVRSVEYLVRYETGRNIDGVPDFAWQRTKIAAGDLIWSESYHSDASGDVGMDEDHAIEVRSKNDGWAIWPARRTFRDLTERERLRVFNPPDVYLVATGWWPMRAPSPTIDKAPLSIRELRETRSSDESMSESELPPEDAWEVIEQPTGRVTLKSRDAKTELEFDPDRGFALTRRKLIAGENTVVYIATSLLEVDGFWLPRTVTQSVTTPAGAGFSLECECVEVQVNHLDAGNFALPRIPGLYDVGSDDGSEVDAFRNRQVVAGGEEILFEAASELNERFRGSSWLRAISWICAFFAGAVMVVVIRRR